MSGPGQVYEDYVEWKKDPINVKSWKSRQFEKHGFSFLEVLVPCPVGFGKSNQMEEGLDELLLYRNRCVVGEGVPLEKLGIDFSSDQPIYVGRFVDRDAPAYKPIDRTTKQ